jgi:serine/threonine protein phosphatase PrpC
MIAKQTIIGSERVLRGTPLARSAQSIAHMAVALQWHVATNANEPVALATSRSAETGIGEKDVLLVVADCTRCQAHDARIASALAHHIFDSYNARQSKAAGNGSGGNGADRLDVAHWLSDAVISGLKYVSQHERVTADGIALADSPVDPASLAVVATVIHHDKLFVARYGGGRVYLLRGGALQNLTDSSFAATHAEATEPDLGQLDLAGEDRVLLCSDAFHNQLNDTQIKSVLRGTPSSRRAAQTLLEAATRNGTDETVALAVADYVTGRAGVFPAQPIEPSVAAPVSGPRRGTFRSIAGVIGIVALVIAAVWVISALNGRGGGAGTDTNTIASTAMPDANATLPAVIAPITATATAAATSEPSPTAAPTDTPQPSPTPTATLEPTATQTPEPTATATATPEPTATPRPRPTRRPTQTPTAAPLPTATPIPPTPTPAGPPPTPTITPVPPWELQPPAPPPPQPPACDPSTLPPGSVCP